MRTQPSGCPRQNPLFRRRTAPATVSYTHLPAAALKIACDLVDEGMIDEKQAVAMIDPRTLDTLLHPQFDGEVLKKTPVIGSALAASPGAACGKVVFSAEDAKAWAERGEKVVLVRLETSPEDLSLIHIFTKLEGITGKKFGDLENPLLVSVRSGARASMPLSLIHI